MQTHFNSTDSLESRLGFKQVRVSSRDSQKRRGGGLFSSISHSHSDPKKMYAAITLKRRYQPDLFSAQKGRKCINIFFFPDNFPVCKIFSVLLYMLHRRHSELSTPAKSTLKCNQGQWVKCHILTKLRDDFTENSTSIGQNHEYM